MGGFGLALDALGGKCIFMSELEGKFFFLWNDIIVSTSQNDVLGAFLLTTKC